MQKPLTQKGHDPEHTVVLPRKRTGSAGPLLAGFPLLAQGRLIDLYGLTLSPTLHRLMIDGKILFSCCALWAHVIPKLVDATVQVDSVDPMQQELMHLCVSPSGVESANPPGAAATLAVSNQKAIDANVGEAFCHQVRHFVSRESAEAFAAERSTCHAIDISELELAAEHLFRSIWSAVDG